MWRTAVFACLMIASLCLPSGSYAAKTLPDEVSLEEYAAFLKKALGEGVEVKAGLLGYEAKLGEVEIGRLAFPTEGKSDDTLFKIVTDLTRMTCDQSTVQPSTIARQKLDGINLLRQSFECRTMMGPIKFGDAILIEDGDKFEAFLSGAAAEHRSGVAKVNDGIVRVLVEMYR